MDKQTLINNLNEDLAGELGAVIQYLTYAAKASGPYRPQLSAFFLAEVADEQLHAQFLANKIVALGGEPTTHAAARCRPPRPIAEMLEAVLAAEKQATADYTQRAKEAEEYGRQGPDGAARGHGARRKRPFRRDRAHPGELAAVARRSGPGCCQAKDPAERRGLSFSGRLRRNC
ncbi:MAG: ferritin-like domain-containing protein [Anaerolineae bacterium]